MPIIQLKRTKIAGDAPTGLVDGEVAINQKDGTIYWIDDLGARQSFNFKNPALDSPTMNNPTALTQTPGDSSTKVSTTAFVAAAVAALSSAIISGAPTALNTLKKIADSINDDASFWTTVSTALANRLRFDAGQALTPGQKTQLQANAGLATVAFSGSFTDLTNQPPGSEPIATTAQFRAMTPTHALDTTVMTAGAAPVNLGNATGAVTPDYTTFINGIYTLTGATTFQFPTVAVTNLIGMWRRLEIISNGSAIAWAAGYIFDSGVAPAIDTTAGRSNTFSLFIKSATQIEVYMPGRGVR